MFSSHLKHTGPSTPLMYTRNVWCALRLAFNISTQQSLIALLIKLYVSNGLHHQRPMWLVNTSHVRTVCQRTNCFRLIWLSLYLPFEDNTSLGADLSAEDRYYSSTRRIQIPRVRASHLVLTQTLCLQSNVKVFYFIQIYIYVGGGGKGKAI